MTTTNANTPTIVFVYGAWADASGFGESIRAMRDRGFAAIGFANPLRHLTGDAAERACPAGDHFRSDCPGRPLLRRRGYVERRCRERADAGAGVCQWVDARCSLVSAALRPVPFTNPDGSEGLDLYLDREAFAEAFCADIDPERPQ